MTSTKTHRSLGLSSSQRRGSRTQYVVRCSCGDDPPSARTPAGAQALFDQHAAATSADAATSYKSHTLRHADTSFIFVEVADEMHVSEWFGDDLKGVEVVSKPVARMRWRSLCRAGAEHGPCDQPVSALFLGLDRSRLPREVVDAAWTASRG